MRARIGTLAHRAVLAGVCVFLFLWAEGCLAASPGLQASGPSSDSLFLSSLPDVPLMPGFEEMEADLTLFDKPDGRIVEAYALGPRTSAVDVTDYYRTILPRFGWVSTASGIFIRQAERVVIETAQAKGRTLIRYTLSPSGNGRPATP